jgi:hypothetical protein
MKRTQPNPVSPGAPQLNMLANDIDNRHCCANAVNVVVRDSHTVESSSRRMPSYHSRRNTHVYDY